jgi:hypothetical protein
MSGSMIGLIGFLLSPLSWWNDFFINIPLAVGFGWIVSLAYRPLFEPAVVVGYWLTNLLGFVLLHKGAQTVLIGDTVRPYTSRELIKDLCISLPYTGVVVALIQLKVLQPIGDYFIGTSPVPAGH